MNPRKIDSDQNSARPKGHSGAAFSLAQVGAHAASTFAERLSELKLTPADAGIFRILAATPAITQQAVATALGTMPSRLVALIDELESRGLLERRPHETDRRSYALQLTDAGKSTLQAIGHFAREHQHALLAALSEDEQTPTRRSLATRRGSAGADSRRPSSYAGVKPLRPARV